MQKFGIKPLKSKAPAFVVNGTIGGHPFINHKNHARGAALVLQPVIVNVAKATTRKLKSDRDAIIAGNAKGAV